MSRTMLRMFSLLMLVLILGTGAAHALPSSHRMDVAREAGVLASAWEWLASLFATKSPLLAVFEADETMTQSDPSPEPQGDIGGFIDPNGGS